MDLIKDVYETIWKFLMNNIRLIPPSIHFHFSIILSNFSVFVRSELGLSLKFIRLKSNNHFVAVFSVAAMEMNIMLILLTSLPQCKEQCSIFIHPKFVIHPNTKKFR